MDKALLHHYAPSCLDHLEIFERVGLPKTYGMNVISLGCGGAEEYLALSRWSPGCQFTGTDYNEKIVENLNSFYKPAQDLKFLVGDYHKTDGFVFSVGAQAYDIAFLLHPEIRHPSNLPPSDPSLDKVIRDHLFETNCTFNALNLVTTLNRILKPGGKVLCYFYKLDELNTFLYVLKKYFGIHNALASIERPSIFAKFILCFEFNKK